MGKTSCLALFAKTCYSSRHMAKKTASQIAVIETGGKQYLVSEGATITIEKLPAKSIKDDRTVVFDKVILTANTAAGTSTVGSPYLTSTVSGMVMEEGRGKKILVQRFRAKSNYHRRYGHRQPFTKVKITKIA